MVSALARPDQTRHQDLIRAWEVKVGKAMAGPTMKTPLLLCSGEQHKHEATEKSASAIKGITW